jgi:alkaline phosphatase D
LRHSHKRIVVEEEFTMKIAVASCCKIQSINPQPVWRLIKQEAPDVLLLIGDNIYLDHDRHNDPAELASELRDRYSAQFAEPSFASLLADLRTRNAPVIAIYDDHDFLGNNRYGGDHAPALREAARAEFVGAFGPKMTGSDVYSIARLGLVDIVVLDERFYRTSPSVSGSDRDAVLGQAQWAWLEQTLNADTNAKYTLIASSTTLHTFGDESWEQYPSAFQRLTTLLSGRKGALVVSGDVHRNATYDDSGVIEIVTSGVARNGIVFGSPRENYGFLTFDEKKLHVDLRSLKVGGRFDFSIPLSKWVLP